MGLEFLFLFLGSAKVRNHIVYPRSLGVSVVMRGRGAGRGAKLDDLAGRNFGLVSCLRRLAAPRLRVGPSASSLLLSRAAGGGRRGGYSAACTYRIIFWRGSGGGERIGAFCLVLAKLCSFCDTKFGQRAFMSRRHCWCTRVAPRNRFSVHCCSTFIVVLVLTCSPLCILALESEWGFVAVSVGQVCRVAILYVEPPDVERR